MTMTEKIMAKASDKGHVTPGDNSWVICWCFNDTRCLRSWFYWDF